MIHKHTLPAFRRCLGFAAATALTLCVLLFGTAWGQDAAPGAKDGERILVVGTDYNDRPYQFLDQNGSAAGFDIELIQAVARSLGIGTRIRPGSREQNMEDLVAGRIDIIAGTFRTEARAGKISVSTPYRFAQHCLFVRKGSGIASIDDASGKTIVVIRDDATHDFVTAKRISNKIVAAAAIEDALRLLASGAGDCSLLPKDLGLYKAAEMGLSNVEVVGEPVFRADYGFAVRKGDAALIARLNEGLSVVMTGGTYRHLHDKWLKTYELPANAIAAAILRYSLIVLVSTAVLALLAFFVSRIVTGLVNARTADLVRKTEIQKQTAGKLKAEIDGLIAILRSSPYGIAVLNGWDWNAEIIYFNRALIAMIGHETEDMVILRDFAAKVFPDPEYMGRVQERWERMAREGFSDAGFALSMTRSDGETIRADFKANPIGDGRYIAMFADVTDKLILEEERERLDEQIRQSQKLEAMGQLAGGVSHDFNNLLSPILGNAELIQMELGGDHECNPMIEEIIVAAKRAGEVTRQLLAYARKGKFQIVPVDVHRSVRGVIGMLQHSIDKLIEISEDLQAEKPTIMGDPSQIQGALLNLGINARDAMAGGGRLTFSTRMVEVDKEMCRKAAYGITPGEYLQIRVSDTGVGMTAAVRARLFEPFFTTKKAGKGTGLGLAAVYGCVKNHHGTIDVESEIGKGTTFSILFPAVGGEKGPLKETAQRGELALGKGHILVVDDEELVRRFTTKALNKLGYKVSTYMDGALAVDFYREHWNEVDLVVMDLIMPNMDGRTAFAEMKKINPDIRLIVASGYAADKTAVESMELGALEFLAKPVQMASLASAVARHIGNGTKAQVEAAPVSEDPGGGSAK